MKKKAKILTAIALVTLCSQSCLADQGDVNAALKVGTLGIGAEAGVGLSDDIAFRGGVNLFRYSFDSTIGDIDYDMETTFKNVSLLLDWHPFGGAFRLSGGIYLNGNEIDVDGTYRQDKLPPEFLQNPGLTGLARVKGTVDFNAVSPYLGLGWVSNHGRKGWGVAFDAGVLFQGSPNVSDLYLETPPGLQTPIESIIFLDEQRKEIEDDLDQFQYYPSLSLTVNYNF